MDDMKKNGARPSIAPGPGPVDAPPAVPVSSIPQAAAASAARKAEIKNKIAPLVPNLQKLFRFIAGGSILPTSVSFENVKVNEHGILTIGQKEIGRMVEDKEGVSVRIFFSKLDIKEGFPEILKTRFPLSDTMIAVHKSYQRFFIVTEKTVSVAFAREDEGPPQLSIFGSL